MKGDKKRKNPWPLKGDKRERKKEERIRQYNC